MNTRLRRNAGLADWGTSRCATRRGRGVGRRAKALVARSGLRLGAVALVVGVVLMLATVFFLGVRRVHTLGLKWSGDRVVSALQKAQQLAVMEACECKVRMIPAGNHIYISRLTTDDAGTHECAIHDLTATVSGGVRIESTTFPHHEVIFDANGAPDRAGEIVLSRRGVEKAVVEVTQGTGFARVKPPARK